MTIETDIEPMPRRRQLGEPVAGLDALIHRAYRRLSWRLPLVCAAMHWVVVVALHVLFVVAVGRIEGVSGHERVVWLGRIAIGLAAATAAALWASNRVLQPLARQLQDSSEDAARDALALAQRLPLQFIVVNLAAGVLFSLPVTFFSTLAVVDARPSMFILLGLTGLGAGLLLCISSWAWYRLMMMPMLRELSQRVPERMPGHSGPSVSTALIISIPSIAYGCGVGAVVVSAPPHAGLAIVLERFLVVLALSLPFIVPVALLLAHASVHPLGDLISAAKRLQAGEYDQHVPVLPGAEFEALAVTFNSAMDGLAERQRLAAANTVLLEEVRASRARIVAAGDVERRRVERNIHDGAQQRLVALALELRMLEDVAAASAAPQIGKLARDASTSLKAALDELRELARGLHPAVLGSDGIRPALDQVAARSPVPVRVTAPSTRFATVVESTVYFVACEALSNVAKHARATGASVEVVHDGDLLTMTVTDDGIGGAEMGAGTGLQGMADRLAALAGSLLVSSSSSGTTLIAQVPVGGPLVEHASAVEAVDDV